MDFEFIRAYAPLYASAAGLTLTIAIFGIVLSVVIGLLCSLVKIFKIPVLSAIVNGYIEISRNTPLLIQLFFLYFGLPKIGIVLSSETCAVTGLAFLGGSYMAEAFRTGIEQVPKIQTDSGLSLGLTRLQIFRFIILPQAVATSVPVFCANIIFLIKETSVFSAVALADLMFVAKDLIGIYYKTDEALFMLVISYLLILLPVSVFCTWLERRVRYAEFGNSNPVSGK
ncbi:MAG: polar amino acid transporter, inner rane subunit [Lacrimispora sp.]|nr:polar amino acid transporter, inner rane subunit [Lacrimispora sp.]